MLYLATFILQFIRFDTSMYFIAIVMGETNDAIIYIAEVQQLNLNANSAVMVSNTPSAASLLVNSNSKYLVVLHAEATKE